jgi:hypothetical protein
MLGMGNGKAHTAVYAAHLYDGAPMKQLHYNNNNNWQYLYLYPSHWSHLSAMYEKKGQETNPY